MQPSPNWQHLYPKHRYRIFFIDDKPFWVDSVGEALQKAGYQSFTCNNLEDAKSILDSTHLHVGIFDVNLRSEKGNSFEPAYREGLDLAVSLERPTVRLMFTVHNNMEHIQRAYSIGKVADYVLKDEDENLDALLEKLDAAIQNHLLINYDLVIHWENTNLFELVQKLNPRLDLETQYERMMEFEDLLRMQFYRRGSQFYLQISLKLMYQMRGLLCLKLQAYSEDGRLTSYLMFCGERDAMQGSPFKVQGRLRYEHDVIQTSHYQIELQEVVNGDLREIDSLKAFWQAGKTDFVASIIEEFVLQNLRSNANRRRDVKEQTGALSVLALGLNRALDHDDIDNLLQIARRISHEWDAHYHENRLVLENEKLHYSLNAEQSYPNPIYHLASLSEMQVKRKVGMVQGDLSLETLLANENDESWIWLESENYRASLLHDYVSLELSLQLSELSRLEWEDFAPLALMLNSYESPSILEDLPPNLREVLGLIQRIRASAIRNLNCKLEDYLQDLYMAFIAYLSKYPQRPYAGYESLLQYTYALLFASQICHNLLEGQIIEIPKEGLRFDDERRLVSVWWQSVSLSPQQYNIFYYMYENRGEVCSYKDIIEKALNESSVNKQSDQGKVYTAIHRLRSRIEILGFDIVHDSDTGYQLVKK